MSIAHRLAQRRALLVVECNLQRATLLAQVQRINEQTTFIKTSNNLFKGVKKIPNWALILLGGLGVGSLVFSPQRVIAIAKSSIAIWKFFRNYLSNPKANPE